MKIYTDEKMKISIPEWVLLPPLENFYDAIKSDYYCNEALFISGEGWGGDGCRQCSVLTQMLQLQQRYAHLPETQKNLFQTTSAGRRQ